jgi:molybdate transport system ATP-binding protein
MTASLDLNLHLNRGSFLLDAQLALPVKGITAIFGSSGCGKTSLLRAIAGLEPETTGDIRFGESVWQQANHIVPAYQRAIGYVFQEASLFPHLSVKENLHYGIKRMGKRMNMHSDKFPLDFDEVVRLLGVESLLERDPQGLSGGERQRVAIARALLPNPDLLLMDEPLAALDANSKRDILPYLDRLHRELNIPILYVSHSADEVARLADYLVLMESGRIQAHGAINTMLTRLDLPLAHHDNAEAVIEARVTGFDEAYDLMQLSTAAGEFNVARQNVELGQSVRLRLLARDISLTLKSQTESSILNVIPIKIEEIAAPYQGSAQSLIRLDAGGESLLARLTRKSVAELGLQEGQRVYAQVKSVAVLS